MKTKKQLFAAAMNGPDPKYNTLLQLLDVITDIRNIYLHCVMMDEGKDEEAVGEKLRRLYGEEILDDTCKEDCLYRDRKEHLMPACKFGGEPIIKNGLCESYIKEEKDA